MTILSLPNLDTALKTAVKNTEDTQRPWKVWSFSVPEKNHGRFDPYLPCVVSDIPMTFVKEVTEVFTTLCEYAPVKRPLLDQSNQTG